MTSVITIVHGSVVLSSVYKMVWHYYTYVYQKTEILVKNGAEIDSVGFLLSHGVNAKLTTSIGYTPLLYQVAQ